VWYDYTNPCYDGEYLSSMELSILIKKHNLDGLVREAIAEADLL
jgi:hypothetical protein